MTPISRRGFVGLGASVAAGVALGATTPVAWRWLLHRSWLMARLSKWLLPPSLRGWMCSNVAAWGNTCSPHTQQGTTPCNWRATVL